MEKQWVEGQGLMVKDSDIQKEKSGSAVALSDRVMPLPIDRQADDTPIIDRPVLAIVEHWNTKGRRFAILKAVNEDDCCWRTVDDGSELSHDWDVIAWDYLPEQEKA